ncbi:TOMM precursor leader peptide-binding protein [Kitasatospora viridis]|uniref:Ribosomal protein S12 methylthiotransferase accessory factor n=1 Tax=Kitasatospora viridis TaxID=281105 RepID=A0A561TVM7_9ACTN|nr:TOMM precursor leader peptide-binding protein [Kitasatospora viridis]TWF91164.1 ribosomal protein S12 methylthiotransferase accessory factor [Kitasatospora viridis]
MAEQPHLLLEPRQVVVGPWEPGCPECLRTRRTAAASAESAAELAVEVPERELPSFLADTVAELASARAEAQRFWIVDLATLALSRHGFLTDPRCPRCSRMPADTEQGAKATREARPKLSPESTRVRLLDRDALAATYVDEQSGLIPSVTSYVHHSFPFTEAVMAVPGVVTEAAGYGRTRDFSSAWSISVVESLERLSGYAPGKRTGVTAAYAEVADAAVDPRSLGLYPADRYRTPGFRYREFTEDAVTNWVWGHSFGLDRPVLVPESFVYYRLSMSGGEPGFAQEISSGNALGGCYEEAVLHGILEVAERDAFLMAWYQRTALPEIDLATVPDRRIRLVAERIERQGYRVHVFDSTREHGIPSFWTLAEDVTGTERPRAVSTGGSGLRPAEAILAALHELSQTVEYVAILALDPNWQRRARHLADHPDDVHTMADHLLCAADPASFDRYSFLLDDPVTWTWEQRLDHWHWPRNTDIGADLDEAVRRFAAAGLDVVAVDTTSTEQTAGGFRCVKVLAPGSVPMTFGHAARRVTGLPRLSEVRNPHPHPFP